jgi:acetyl-CoA acetyltransferase
MTRFGKHVDRTARDLVEEAVSCALREAELEPRMVQAVYVGNALDGQISGQAMIRGQVVLRRTGLMGVPMVNVENADASGSSALHLGWQAVASGVYDRVLVVGYEKYDHEDKVRSYQAAVSNMDLAEVAEIFASGDPGRLTAPTLMLGASVADDDTGRITREAMVEVAVKNHYHGSLNPWARHRSPVTAEQVLASRRVAGPLTRLMCSSIADGAACLVLGSTRSLPGRSARAQIVASGLWSGRGDDMRRQMSTVLGVRDMYETAGIGPEDVDVVELADTTASTELYLYAMMDLCEYDEVSRFAIDRVTWLGGRVPVNPSGGMLARGNPSGATGVAQVVELVWQLEGRCGQRQVASPMVALAHCGGGWIGADVGATTVHVLTR